MPTQPHSETCAMGQRHCFVLKQHVGYVLEMEDVHFHHDSAVLMPDFAHCDTTSPSSEGNSDHFSGLAVIAACYAHAAEHPGQKLLITGHTDTSGTESYNQALSQKRADNVLSLLLGNNDGWVQVVNQQHQVEDCQQILKWIADVWFWDCDPGPVDNKKGPQTETGIAVFQSSYNREFQKSLTEDGKVGPQTWGAIFDVYMQMLWSMMGTDEPGLVRARQSLTF